MADRLIYENYVNVHPGREQSGPAIDMLKVARSEGFLGLLPANNLAMMRSWVPLGTQFFGHGYQIDDEVQTLNSGTIAMGAGGLVFTSAASSTEVNTRGARTILPATGMYFETCVQLASTTAATCGVFLGICNVDTTPIASDPTDGVWITCSNASAALTASVRGNSGTKSDQTTFNIGTATLTAVSLVDVTNMELGIKFYIGATAAASWGEFWINGFPTQFTAGQITQLFAIMTTPPQVTRYLGLQADGSARVVTVQYLVGGASKL